MPLSNALVAKLEEISQYAGSGIGVRNSGLRPNAASLRIWNASSWVSPLATRSYTVLPCRSCLVDTDTWDLLSNSEVDRSGAEFSDVDVVGALRLKEVEMA